MLWGALIGFIVLGYKPATAPAIASAIIYILTGLAFIMWYRRHPGRYMLTLIIAVYCYVVGLVLRPGMFRALFLLIRAG